MTDFDQMVRQQRILADFGDYALNSEDLDSVLTQACHLIGEALGTDLAKVLEIEDDEQTLFVRAGIGWQAGVVGSLRLPISQHSSETYAIRQGVPVITTDIRSDDRFGFPDFMKAAGVIGVINVPIFLPGGKPYGLLQVDSREVWKPGEQDVAFLRTYACILGPVIDRLHEVHALRRTHDRNETLLHELQHRIKNNIGAITSLVGMRMKHTATEEARSELRIVGERIEALRLVHEHVYTARSADRLPLGPYVTELLAGLLALHEKTAVRLDVQITDVEVASDTAIPLGLILNEFTTNSIKYAFEGDDRVMDGMIVVEASQRDGPLRVSIRDNGKGLPAGMQPPPRGSGTGMVLIDRLSRQIGAKPEWTSERGAALRLEIPRQYAQA